MFKCLLLSPGPNQTWTSTDFYLPLLGSNQNTALKIKCKKCIVSIYVCVYIYIIVQITSNSKNKYLYLMGVFIYKKNQKNLKYIHLE